MKSSSEPKERRWFQIHLSTAIILFLLSGALLPVVIWVITNWAADAARGGIYLDQIPVYALILIGCALLLLATGMLSEWFARRNK